MRLRRDAYVIRILWYIWIICTYARAHTHTRARAYVHTYIQCIIHRTVCCMTVYFNIYIGRKSFDRENTVETTTRTLSVANLCTNRKLLISSLSECLSLNYSKTKTNISWIVNRERCRIEDERKFRRGKINRCLYIVLFDFPILTKGPVRTWKKTISYRGKKGKKGGNARYEILPRLL